MLTLFLVLFISNHTMLLILSVFGIVSYEWTKVLPGLALNTGFIEGTEIRTKTIDIITLQKKGFVNG